MNKNLKVFLFAVGFGLLGLVIILVKFTIPRPYTFPGGTPGVIDIREIVGFMGSALVGPFGAIITGILVSLGDGTLAPGFMLPSLIGHAIAYAVQAYEYKIIYQRMKFPARLLGWILVCATGYFLFAPIVVTYYYFTDFNHDLQLTINTLLTFWGQWFVYEFPISTIITSIFWIALPESFRRPLWIEPKK
jgi:hypothetical protein